jgi:cellulose biosynthesis protein BcsQ
LRTEFDRVLQNAIPYSSEVERMGLERLPVIDFAPSSKAAVSYQKLWEEIYQEMLN